MEDRTELTETNDLRVTGQWRVNPRKLQQMKNRDLKVTSPAAAEEIQMQQSRLCSYSHWCTEIAYSPM